MYIQYASTRTAYSPFLYWPTSQPTFEVNVATIEVVKFNANSTGYYRVMYDEYGWQQLTTALNQPNFGKLGADDRLGLLMDAFVFARDERLTWKTLLPLLQFLQYETSAHKTSHLQQHACRINRPLDSPSPNTMPRCVV